MTDTAYKNFTDLEVWKKAWLLKNELKDLTSCFPGEEKFRLTDQLIRSSRSLAATIAEGNGRFTYKDQIHFCIMARGSVSETLNHIIDAYDCKYISQEQLIYYKDKIDEVHKLINGYITFLRKNIKP